MPLLVVLWIAAHAAAQDQTGLVQRLTGRLEPGETHAYLLRVLQPGDKTNVSMHATSGDLDPSVGIMDTREFHGRYSPLSRYKGKGEDKQSPSQKNR